MSALIPKRKSTLFLPVLFTAFLFPVFAENPLHTVAEGETLYGLARQYQIPLSWLQRINELEDPLIKPGQELAVPGEEPMELKIKSGDTLSELALAFGLNLGELRALNNLQDDNIREGMMVKIPPVPRVHQHLVEAGDTLSAIALQYQIKEETIKKINRLKDDTIKLGQLLAVEIPRPRSHQVVPGETLWSLSRHYQISLADLAAWNNLKNQVLYPGQKLQLYQEPQGSSSPALASLPLQIPQKSRRENLPRDGEYYWSAPRSKTQPHKEYSEDPENSLEEDYRRALKVLEDFEHQISALPPLGTQLKGWRIVIDPGHGGRDPGAIVNIKDGNDQERAVTEDEYAYDISLRLYRTLRRYGARVNLTILAPDHQIRQGENPRATFVNRKSEVYAREDLNRGSQPWRPIGTLEGLEIRKEIAKEHLKKGDPEKHLFLSIHADNSPELPEGTAVLVDGKAEEELAASLALAKTLLPQLGSGAFFRRQSLRVLQDNPAAAAVLIEVRNLAYQRNAWALRVPELREQDSSRIAQGILQWAKR